MTRNCWGVDFWRYPQNTTTNSANPIFQNVLWSLVHVKSEVKTEVHTFQKQTRSYFNPLTPNDHYSGRTAPLTFKVAFYIFIQQI